MIVILYAVIGLMAAASTIFIAPKILAPKAEQIFYAMFLIMIAFYLAFAAYFGVATAWRLETAVVVAFVAIGLLGVRLPFALIVGYPVHGLWDLLHELQAHGGYSAFEPGQLDRDPTRLRNLLCGLRLVHGGVCLYATRRVECRMEGGCHSENSYVVGSSAAVASASTTSEGASVRAQISAESFPYPMTTYMVNKRW